MMVQAKENEIMRQLPAEHHRRRDLGQGANYLTWSCTAAANVRLTAGIQTGYAHRHSATKPAMRTDVRQLDRLYAQTIHANLP